MTTQEIPKQPNEYCYNEWAKKQLAASNKRFFRLAAKQLPEFQFKGHFSAGGIAVWGEVYAKISQGGVPKVEAYNTEMGMLVRQWDGRNSGRNHYVQNMEQFVKLVKQLAAAPFVRF